MAERESNPFGEDPGLDLDATLPIPDDERFLEVETAEGQRLKLKVIFAVVDKEKAAAYIFVDEGNDEVLALATSLDKEGNPLQDELAPVGESSPYLEAVQLYLQAYNEGQANEEDLNGRVKQLRAEKALKAE